MKNTAITALLGILILTSLSTAATINCNIFYTEDISQNTKTIIEGDSIELAIDANNILGETMVVELELWKNGNKMKTLFSYNTLNDNYFTNYQLTDSDYENNGTYTLKASAKSTTSSTASDELTLVVTAKSIIIVPDTTNPIVTIINPTDGTNYTENQTKLTFTVDEDNLDYCQYNIGNGWTNLSNCNIGTNSINGLNSQEGTNIWQVRAFDLSGNTGSDLITFEVETPSIPPTPDTTPPILRMITPEDGKTYPTNQTNITYSVYDETLDYCEYSLNNGTTWKSISCNNGLNIITGIKSDEGTNNWLVRARDIPGRITVDSVSFVVKDPTDRTAPSLNITSPRNGWRYFQNQTTINYEVYDENLDYCEYSLDNGLTWKGISCNNGQNQITGISSNTGENNWLVRARDMPGRITTKKINFEVLELNLPDTTIPSINITTPTNNKTYQLNQTIINFNVYDNNLDYCQYNINGTWMRFNCSNGANLITGLNSKYGNNIWKVRAIDKSNNIGEDMITFNVNPITIDTTAPTITLLKPSDGKEFLENQSIEIEVLLDENATVIYELNNTNTTMTYRSNTSWNYLSNNFTLPLGTYTIKIYATDDNGNTAYLTFTIKIIKDSNNGKDADNDDKDKNNKRGPNEDNYWNESPWNLTNTKTNCIILEPQLTWWQRFVLWLKRLFKLI